MQQSKPAPAGQPQPRKGGFVGLLLGGVCAAAIGFGAAYYIFPQLGIMAPVDTAATDVQADLAQQSERISALDARIDAIPGAPDTSGIEAGQADLEAKLAEMSDRINSLSGRIDELEAQPTGPGDDGVTIGQLNDLRRTIKAQGEQVQALVAQADERAEAAQAAAQQDLRRDALSRIRAALDSGAPFAAALGDLERAGMSAPDPLQDVAEAGVPTRSALQQSFAPAAREALARARRSGDEGTGGDFWSFVSGQLGARSLERREGSSTDAILSRAEDDLRQGNLAAALTEVDTLTGPAAAELADWAASARTRMQATDAYDALAAKLN
ncbi:COG4223 family protein [Roseovarius dicentrarchi]|uniref:COG4223 family protein n=1 Tax=Roseovarius dicentrarchi TaxID=2250573 RepID=UPI0013966FE6|nr:mitofilin family membrane protein [Roseovarius dicentrarchi]